VPANPAPACVRCATRCCLHAPDAAEAANTAAGHANKPPTAHGEPPRPIRRPGSMTFDPRWTTAGPHSNGATWPPWPSSRYGRPGRPRPGQRRPSIHHTRTSDAIPPAADHTRARDPAIYENQNHHAGPCDADPAPPDRNPGPPRRDDRSSTWATATSCSRRRGGRPAGRCSTAASTSATSNAPAPGPGAAHAGGPIHRPADRSPPPPQPQPTAPTAPSATQWSRSPWNTNVSPNASGQTRQATDGENPPTPPGKASHPDPVTENARHTLPTIGQRTPPGRTPTS